MNTLPLENLPSAEDVMARVKRETQQQHTLVESLLAINSEAFSLNEYRTLLEKFLGLYGSLESELKSFNGLPAELRPRLMKWNLLKNDLTALNLPPAPIHKLAEPSIHPIRSIPEALGTMYVLEGSTLGGQYISRIVNQRFGLNRSHGCAFFNSYGDEVGKMWRTFGEVVRQYVTTPGEQQTFVTGAKQAFSYFEQWLSRTHA